jgi:hypothetical protein
MCLDISVETSEKMLWDPQNVKRALLQAVASPQPRGEYMVSWMTMMMMSMRMLGLMMTMMMMTIMMMMINAAAAAADDDDECCC